MSEFTVEDANEELIDSCITDDDNYEKAALWVDGTWCFLCDLEEYLEFMSDDYDEISVDIDDWGEGPRISNRVSNTV